jgi:hypothetical protein
VVETARPARATITSGGASSVANKSRHDLATRPETGLRDHVMASVAVKAGFTYEPQAESVRVRPRADLRFAFTFAAEPRRTPAAGGARDLPGRPELPPASVAAWQIIAA